MMIFSKLSWVFITLVIFTHNIKKKNKHLNFFFIKIVLATFQNIFKPPVPMTSFCTNCKCPKTSSVVQKLRIAIHTVKKHIGEKI